MSIYIDKTFINRISSQLRNFKWKKDTLANCSCPICGDSTKTKTKARGYFYVKGNDFFYKCHNCNHGSNVYNFLKQVQPSLCKEYSLESYRGGGKVTTPKVSKENMFKFTSKKPKFKKKDKLLNELVGLNDLPSEHTAIKFANMRMIPKEHFKLLYYTDDFTSFAKNIDADNTLYGKEERLVIPFFNSHGDVVACQGRALTMSDETKARETVKYITIKGDKSIDRLWYGLWRVDPKKRVYVVEGPIDSLFIKNSTAMVGAGALRDVPLRFENSEMTYILDNEPRNRQICAYIEKLIDLGRDVCIWPDNIIEKDINDMVYKLSTRKIQKIIDENTFNGLEATLRFRDWRKV
ncbi:MAG: DNA primase [Proteobacteria bacterium]|nr:DNA primase [Pseudomonadota bacterium]